jgi:hypothetical protein
MVKLTASEIISKIKREEVFHAVCSDYSFIIKVSDYVPYAAVSLGSGNQLSTSLVNKLAISSREKWLLEEPALDIVIKDLPITITCLDSILEYDVNASAKANTELTIWNKPLSDADKLNAKTKHEAFYRVVLFLLVKLEELFGTVVFYDFRAATREILDNRNTFTIGTALIKPEIHSNVISQWKEILEKIDISSLKATTAGIDQNVGGGVFATYIKQNSLNSIVIPLYLSPIYLDKERCIIYPEIVQALRDQFKYYVKAHAHRFYDNYQLDTET